MALKKGVLPPTVIAENAANDIIDRKTTIQQIIAA